MFKIIKSFNPKPGLKFEQVDLPIREPDLQVYETEDGWLVELNNSTLPNIKIEKAYAKDLRDKFYKKMIESSFKQKFQRQNGLQKQLKREMKRC